MTVDPSAAERRLPGAGVPAVGRRSVRLGAAQARRVAIAAQGLTAPRPGERSTMRHLQRVLDTVGILQIDSVNVLARSHYLSLFSRLGPYPRALADRAAGQAPRRMVEYWAHEASFVPPTTHRLLRYRMHAAQEQAWSTMVSVARQAPRLPPAVLELVRARGPLTAVQIEAAIAPGGLRDRTNWGWNWSETKRAVEYLFWAGELTSAGRTAQFERRYDVPERVLPPAVLGLPEATPEQSWRDLVEIAARAHGVAGERCLRDYFRLRPAQARSGIAQLVEEGVLVPAEVAGWTRPAYLHRDARLPRRVGARALLSPFDPLVWERSRTEDLFGFRYRLEIYTPAEKRVHGYYVLPFLLGDRLVARVDLKADRQAGTLRVRAAWVEPWVQDGPGGTPDDPRRPQVAAELAAELADLGAWLELDTVDVEPRGDLATHLRVAVSAG